MLQPLSAYGMENPDNWGEKVNTLFTVVALGSALPQPIVKLNEYPLDHRGEQLGVALPPNANLIHLDLSRTGSRGDQLHLFLQNFLDLPTLSTFLLAEHRNMDASVAPLF
ncbi:hypothetical protein [Candidatus Paracaedibacter symbiosus]|uniref:hypothetical protein n=1 Tax=Candidatus Paracaedibacter symbiosus TaxID=244582 RepID=UPI0012EB928E|nr:hypothetical protein [Candidatus Paracaedibacter symbiosus]